MGQGPTIAISERETGVFAVLTVDRATTSHRAVIEASREVSKAGWSPIDTVSAMPQPNSTWRVELQVRRPTSGRAHL